MKKIRRQINIEVDSLGHFCFRRQLYDDLSLCVVDEEFNYLLIHDDHGNTIEHIDITPIKKDLERWEELFFANYLDWDCSSWTEKEYDEFWIRDKHRSEEIYAIADKTAEYFKAHLPETIAVYRDGYLFKDPYYNYDCVTFPIEEDDQVLLGNRKALLVTRYQRELNFTTYLENYYPKENKVEIDTPSGHHIVNLESVDGLYKWVNQWEEKEDEEQTKKLIQSLYDVFPSDVILYTDNGDVVRPFDVPYKMLTKIPDTVE